MSCLFGAVKCRELVQPYVRHLRDPDMSFPRIGIALILELCLGEDFEERRLAHLGQTDDASFHEVPSMPLHDTCALKGLFDDTKQRSGIRRDRYCFSSPEDLACPRISIAMLGMRQHRPSLSQIAVQRNQAVPKPIRPSRAPTPPRPPALHWRFQATESLPQCARCDCEAC